MKKIITATLVMLSLAACKERESDPNKLPDATQTGANTGGALVNGEVWVASRQRVDPLNGATYCYFDGKFSHITVNLKSSTGQGSIILSLDTNKFEINKVYPLPVQSTEYFTDAHYINETGYFTKQPDYTGWIKISRLDIDKQIVSGTFEFNCISSKSNTVHITQGRFDKKFD